MGVSDGVPICFVSSEDLIDILWERGVPPTVVAERMAYLSECRDADNLRAEIVRKMKEKTEQQMESELFRKTERWV